jgi:quinoprotein glucose dehydrogenase
MGRTAFAQAIPGAAPESAAALARGEWPAYAALRQREIFAAGSDRQIQCRQAARRRRWTSPDQAFRQRSPDSDPSWTNQSTPLMVGGTLYVSTPLSQVAAIDAISGQTKWVFNPQVHGEGIPSNNGWLHRGVAYWKSGTDERIILAGAHGIMVALEAHTGRPIPSFGDNGRVDLKRSLRRRPPRGFYTVSSPPVIVRDVIVVGSSIWDTPAHRRWRPATCSASTCAPASCCGLQDHPRSGRARRRNLGQRSPGRRRAAPMSGRR